MPLGGALVGGAVALGQLGYGAYQTYKGNKMKDEAGAQPAYNIPLEQQQNLSMAHRMALQGLPEEQRQLALQNIQRSSNMGLGALSSRNAGIAGVGGLVQAQNDAFGNLAAQDSQARLSNQLRLIAQNNVMSGYRDKAFQINKMQPWQRQYGEAQNMIGAGAQNIGNALGTGASVAMNYANNMARTGDGHKMPWQNAKSSYNTAVANNLNTGGLSETNPMDNNNISADDLTGQNSPSQIYLGGPGYGYYPNSGFNAVNFRRS